MTATWTINRLPSQVRVRPPSDRSDQLRLESLAIETQRLRLAMRANGIPDPNTLMW